MKELHNSFTVEYIFYVRVLGFHVAPKPRRPLYSHTVFEYRGWYLSPVSLGKLLKQSVLSSVSWSV